MKFRRWQTGVLFLFVVFGAAYIMQKLGYARYMNTWPAVLGVIGFGLALAWWDQHSVSKNSRE